MDGFPQRRMAAQLGECLAIETETIIRKLAAAR
jgi:hypothetical protein